MKPHEKFGLFLFVVSCTHLMALFVLGNGDAGNAYNNLGKWIDPLPTIIMFAIGVFIFMIGGSGDK